MYYYTEKHVLSGHSKIDKTNVLKTGGSLIQAIIGIEKQFWSSFERLLKTGFTVSELRITIKALRVLVERFWQSFEQKRRVFFKGNSGVIYSISRDVTQSNDCSLV